MPASESTWRDQRLLHRIFAVSGVALLGATMWMLYADHDREWKRYQDQARDIELTYNDWYELQYQTNEAVKKHDALAEGYERARTAPVDANLLDQFKAETENFQKFAQSFGDNAPEDESQQLYESLDIPGLAKGLNDAITDMGDDPATADAKSRDLATHARTHLMDALDRIVARVKFHEINALSERKFRNADLDAAKAKLDIAIRDNRPDDEQERIEVGIREISKGVEDLKRKYQALADHRDKLQGIVKQIRAGESEAKKLRDDNLADLKKLQSTHVERRMTYFVDRFPWLGKKWLTLPILDAFNSPRKIDNLWSDDLTIDYNFRRVRRFDRCTTCHQAMDKTKPGTTDQPQFHGVQPLTLQLTTPARDEIRQKREEIEQARKENPKSGGRLDVEDELLLESYGIRLADEGLVASQDVTVTFVQAGSRAAAASLATASGEPSLVGGADVRRGILETPQSNGGPSPGKPDVDEGLALGDVITHVNGNAVDHPSEVVRQLVLTADFGKPVKLTVRRGFVNPYASHPRLDLYLASASPHRMQTFACTVCHEGQGSATQFKWSSHSPNDVQQRKQWARDHGWFDNEHWIFPMFPARFTESACLKCHHSVVELEPSERFPDPPAPKLIHGYNLVRKYGCFGCHEIKGFEGPLKRVGPDMRLESNYFAAAQQLKAVLAAAGAADNLSAEERGWIETLIQSPERSDVRTRLSEALMLDEKAASPRLPTAAHKMASMFKDEETPGELRRPGPSLRYFASKMDEQFAFDWIREPKNFRPSSRMPQFFGLHDHLDGKSRQISEKYEPAEILGMVSYLKAKSQKFDYLPAEKVNEPAAENDDARHQARVQRGKIAFEERGCLACHTHGDFPDVANYRKPRDIVQGPDLTGLGSKFAADRNPNGRSWLYSWIKQPTKYHPRTVMPDLFLDPVVQKDDKGQVVATTDPAADIVDYLLSSTSSSWQPPADIQAAKAALDELVLENLHDAFYEQDAHEFAVKGVPNKKAATLKGPERELLVSDEDFAQGKKVSEEKKLLYIGRKSIGKYGCFGCHDVPGFEDAKTIGTGLADWGRKDPSKLAFEHITHYLHDQEHEHGEHGDGDHGAKHQSPAMPEYYKEQLEGGHRVGFLWQKLAEPRSYDFLKTENKKYNDRLRMPKFPFTEAEREAVITFVLGLVADPPATKYLFRPDPRTAAIIGGRQVIDKFNCAGCHVMRAEKWELLFKPGDFGDQPETKTYPYLRTHVATDDLAASRKQNSAGHVHAAIIGMPSINDADARPTVYDVEGDTVENESPYDPTKVTYPFELWQPAVLDGQVFEPGVMPLSVPAARIEKRWPADGGVLARYLVPYVTQREKQVNPAAKGSESWSWVPPPLVGEGQKVQTAWLHDFLLNPYPIRPAVVLRMPRFNMTSNEAARLVEYFAAVDRAEFPYAATARRQSAYLAEQQTAYQAKVPEEKRAEADRFKDALRIVTNGNYCVKCHLVGDFQPTGAERAKAPNLARIYERLRPNYLRDWIANPKRVLPYTSMPINIPFDPDDQQNLGGVAQDLYHGTSMEQVEALVDLLMNYDNFAKRQTLIAPLVQQVPPPPAEAGAAKDTSGGSQ